MASGGIDGYDEAIHAIYAAALEPERWPHALGRIANAVDATSAMMFTTSHTPGEGGFRSTSGLDDDAAFSAWESRHFHQDPTLVAAGERRLLFEGSVMCCDDLLSPTVLRRSDYYRDVWAPLGIDDFCAGIVFGSTDSRTLPTSLSVFRGRDSVRLGTTERNAVGALLPHVSRALGIMFHLRDRERLLATTLAALDRLPAGVMLVDRHRRVVFHNTAARRMVQGDPLRLLARPGGDELALPTRLHGHEPALNAAIAAALDPFRSRIEHFSHAMVLPAADGAPACVLHVASLDAEAPFGESECAIVIAYDLALAARVPAARLVELFGLTPGEARAALQLLRGGTVAVMAALLNVAESTFKTQLQHAYEKTNTHRQVALLKLLLSLAEP